LPMADWQIADAAKRALGAYRVRCRRRERVRSCPRRSIFTMSNSAVFFVPAARSPRVCFPSASRFTSRAPNRGAGGAPGGGILISIALVRRDPTFARRSRPGANRNGPLGAPPWRFWARSALCVSGVASGFRRAGNLVARVSRPARSRSRTSRAADTAAPRDATPRSACGIVSGGR
jgi:hypothetical protein